MTKCSRSLTLLLDMKQYFLSALLLAAANMGAVAQNFKDEGRIIPLIKSGEYSPQTFGASQMRWTCPEIEQVLEQLGSMKNDDFKVYANKVKNEFKLYESNQSGSKFVVAQAIFQIEQPRFLEGNLIDHIASWLKRQNGWAKKIDIDKVNRQISAYGSVNIATHAAFFEYYKVFIEPSLVIQLKEDNQLLISFLVSNYRNEAYTSSNESPLSSVSSKIADVYPYVQKSSYKTTYAKALVGTYQYLWGFMLDLRNELNGNFSRDKRLLERFQYEYSKDSLLTKYGEPTNIICDKSVVQDIHRELRFYENAQKVVFMGKTIGFKDIVSCKIDDDPSFIPGRTTTYGTGISFFGFGFGAKETSSTASRTIHNYVVNIKVDNLAAPYIRIVTGKNEQKAREIASSFEYILRHQQTTPKKIVTRKKTVVKKNGR